MKQILLIATLVAISITFSLDDTKVCQCSEIINEKDCNAQYFCEHDGMVCAKKECKDIAKESCSKIKGCAPDATGACQKFTKCEDYTVSAVGQCSLKDKSCTEDAKVGAIFKCKTGSYAPHCASITTKSECNVRESASNVCFWKLNATTKKEECASVKFEKCEDGSIDPNLCTSNPACKYVDKKCLQKACKDITTEFFCTNVHAWAGTGSTLCEWKNGCADATGVDSLGQAKCLKSTGGTYTWNGATSKCIPCTGIDGSVKTSPTNGTTTTGTPAVAGNSTVTTTSAQPQGETFLLISALISLALL